MDSLERREIERISRAGIKFLNDVCHTVNHCKDLNVGSLWLRAVLKEANECLPIDCGIDTIWFCFNIDSITREHYGPEREFCQWSLMEPYLRFQSISNVVSFYYDIPINLAMMCVLVMLIDPWNYSNTGYLKPRFILGLFNEFILHSMTETVGKYGYVENVIMKEIKRKFHFETSSIRTGQADKYTHKFFALLSAKLPSFKFLFELQHAMSLTENTSPHAKRVFSQITRDDWFTSSELAEDNSCRLSQISPVLCEFRKHTFKLVEHRIKPGYKRRYQYRVTPIGREVQEFMRHNRGGMI